MDNFDVVVVGGRCAGAATAMLLAGSGLRVLVVDRAAGGSDTISRHMIKPDGVARLAAWGILPDLLGTGCPPISAAEVVIAGQHLARSMSPPPGVPSPMAPRRTILDPLLRSTPGALAPASVAPPPSVAGGTVSSPWADFVREN